MALTNGGMTLYADQDTQETWSGSDDIDTNVFVQGSASEAWLVGKSTTETTNMSKTANMGTAKYFTFWMKSDWGPFYTSISSTLSDGTNTTSFLVATGGKYTPANPNPEISGDFKPSILQIDQGDNASYNQANHTEWGLTVDAELTGNIRAILNHWIDVSYYGDGRIISGSTVNDKLFFESDELDTSNDTFDGCSKLFDSGLAYYTDIEIATTVGNSIGEKVTWYGKSTTDGIFTLLISGSAAFENTSIIGNACIVNLYTTPATAFSMNGGGVSNGGTIDLGSGQTIGSSATFTSCDRVKSASILQAVTITDTTETTTGAYEMQTGTELSNALTDITILNYSGKTAIYIPETITGEITISGIKVDGSGTDVYWASTGGTLTINAANGTNISSWSSAGGTVSIQNSVTLTLTGLPDGIEVRIRQGSHTLHHVQNTTGGSVAYGYNYSGDELVKVSFTGAGIIQSKYLTLTLGNENQTVPVQFENDPSYI